MSEITSVSEMAHSIGCMSFLFIFFNGFLQRLYSQLLEWLQSYISYCGINQKIMNAVKIARVNVINLK